MAIVLDEARAMRQALHRAHVRLENLEDNLEKKDGLANGLIAFVSCVCV